MTGISFASKGYWGYPREFFDIWARELTITPEYIQKNDVVVFEMDGVLTGYYAVVDLQDDVWISGVRLSKGFWLDHMFVEPLSIRKGIGTRLFDHLKRKCVARGIVELGILADPRSRGFYEKMGCEYQYDYPSTIKNRTTPFLLLEINDAIEEESF